jgi:hypothetical protein
MFQALGSIPRIKKKKNQKMKTKNKQKPKSVKRIKRGHLSTTAGIRIARPEVKSREDLVLEIEMSCKKILYRSGGFQ